MVGIVIYHKNKRQLFSCIKVRTFVNEREQRNPYGPQQKNHR